MRRFNGNVNVNGRSATSGDASLAKNENENQNFKSTPCAITGVGLFISHRNHRYHRKASLDFASEKFLCIPCFLCALFILVLLSLCLSVYSVLSV